ncbi:DUF1430 domain-containing protein [Clostridium sp.]|uniref:DUF1430 domain-containing protein n=1 Tax=Clostridium sp. TaxID=1506 RepID=UPI0026DB18A8|nr:DUF1430 domain-containing protein [Clostridium sp.]MDO5040084.1 DUF1430 domain-containing protein [Clostridium sp.]
MRKIIYILLTIQLVILSLLGINIFEYNNINNTFYRETTEIVLNFNDSKNKADNFDTYMIELSKKYNINISKYTKIDEQNMKIYTTDPTFGGKIKLNRGSFPKENSKEFISNINKKDINQTGKFDRVNSNLNIDIKSITNKSEFSNEGIYYLSTIDSNTVNSIVHDLNLNVANTSILRFNDSNRINIRSTLYLIINLALTFVFILVTIIHYSIERSKEIAVLRINGYSVMDIYIHISKTFSKYIVKASLTAYFIIFIYYLYINGFNCIKILSLYFVYIYIVIGLLYNFILLISVSTNIISKNFSAKIKGAKNYNIVNISNLILKLIFIIFLLFYVNLVINQTKDINIKLNNLSQWEKAENLYFLPVKYNGENDEKIHYNTSLKMKKLYDKLSNEKDAILIEPSNYRKINDSYIFDLENKDISPEIDPTGRSIKINKNYLKFNPIISSELSIENQIVYDENTLNLLVPEKLKKYEKEIVSNYRKHFYFEKVEVENINNEILNKNKNKNTTAEHDLNINIIYVKNNQDYFTYDSYIEEDNNNLIRDPIVMIDTGNIDSSYYLSYMTGNVYIKSEKNDVFSDIYPFIKSEELEQSFDKAISLYDSNAEKIDRLQNQKRGCVISIIVLFLSNILVTYNIISAYYEKNKHKIYIKKIFGYSRTLRIMPIIFKVLLVNLLAIILTKLLFGIGINILIVGFLIILIEFILSIVFERMLTKKMFNIILKGEH